MFTIVRFGSNKTAYNEFAWIILEGVEGYDFIRKHLAGVWASLTDLEKDSIRLGQRVLKIRFSLVADYKIKLKWVSSDISFFVSNACRVHPHRT